MCGLAGVAGNINATDLDAFKQLLYLAALRGVDSTGMAVVSFDKMDEARVLKMVGPSPDFLDNVKVRNAIKAGSCLLMGHARYKTVGDITKENAQPFESDNVVGMHNGTLSWGTKNKLEGRKFFSTDSAALIDKIDKESIDDAIKELVYDDAAAIVWYNKEDKTVNFWRNNHRPLWYAIDKTHSTIYWASESAMLYLVLNRNKIEFDKVRELPEFTHMSVVIPEKIELKFEKPRMRPVKQAEKPVVKVVKDNSHVCVTPTVASRTALRRMFSLAKSDTSTNIIPISDRLKDATKWALSRPVIRAIKDGGSFYKDGNKTYDKPAFEKKMDEGCVHDGQIPAWGEPVKFLRDGFLCYSCMARALTGKDFTTIKDIIDQFS